MSNVINFAEVANRKGKLVPKGSVNIQKTILRAVNEGPEVSSTPLNTTEDIVHFLTTFGLTELPEQSTVLVPLDAKNYPTAYFTLQAGANEKDVIKRVLLTNASKFILGENNLSGKTEPSVAEGEASMHLAAVAMFMGMEMVDHLVMDEHDCYTMKEKGII